MELYQVLSLYGSNIVASENEEWRRTKKVVAPAFSEVSHPSKCKTEFSSSQSDIILKRNSRLVWDMSVRVVESLFNEIWKDKDVISVDHFPEITVEVKLCSSKFHIPSCLNLH